MLLYLVVKKRFLTLSLFIEFINHLTNNKHHGRFN